MELLRWGYGPDLETTLLPHRERGLILARVLRASHESYSVATADGERSAELAGRLRFTASSADELPAVGDWVAVDVLPGSSDAIVHAVLPRRSRLARRSASGVQILAANIDRLLVASAADDPRAPARLLRWRALAAEAGVALAVVMTKADLQPDRGAAAKHLNASAGGAPVVCVSVREEDGLAPLAPLLLPGETHVVAGMSGAGKSTLINALLGDERLATREVRADGRGRHTTTARELLCLPSGALLVDTPGLRSLGPADTSGLVEELGAGRECRFRDCRHTGEPGCAVREGMDASDRDRLDRLVREEAFLRLREAEGAARAERLRWRKIMGSSRPRSRPR